VVVDGSEGGVARDVVAGPRLDPELLLVVSHILAAEPDLDVALQRLLEHLIPDMADWGVVHLMDPGRSMRRVSVHHANPAKSDLCRRLLLAAPPKMVGEGLPESMKSGRTSLFNAPDYDQLRALAPNDEVACLWECLGSISTVTVPIVVGAEQIGAFAFTMGDSGRRYRDEDLAWFNSLGAQCALLVQNTRLVREAEQATRERVGISTLVDALLANAPVATAILDPWMRVLHVNDAFAELGGRSVDDCVGQPLGDLVPELAPLILVHAAAVLEGVELGHRIDLPPLPGPSGDRSFQLTAFPIDRPEGLPYGVGVMLIDVSRDRLIAKELLESTTRVALSLGAGGMSSWEWDLRTGEIISTGGLPDSELAIAFADNHAPFEDTWKRFMEQIVPDDRPAAEIAIRGAIESLGDYELEFRVVDPRGEMHWLDTRGRVLPGPNGEPERVLGIAVDVTDRRLIEQIRSRLLDREHQARIEAEAARERLGFLLEASTSLSRTLNPRVVFEQVPGLVVGRFCDACVVDLVDDDGHLEEVAAAASGPGAVDELRALRRRRREAGGDGIWSVRRVARTASSELVVDISDEDYVVAAGDDEQHLELLRRLSVGSAIVTPLVARGGVLGGITLLAMGGRRFTDDDLALADNLAARVAMAVDNARLFQSRSQVARALQQTLLPPALPEIEGLDVAAVYQVAQGGIDIGGDFYDMFELPDGAWAVVIGDVCGKGPGAAAVTGLFRHTVRAVANRESWPSQILRATNDAILGQIDESRFCTAVALRVDPSPGRAMVRVACGGHPRPVVIRAPGGVDALEVSGTLLGVLPDPSLPEISVELLAGDSLVLYTDGVTEARGVDGLFGEARLLDVLRRAAAGGDGELDAAGLADALASAVDAHQDGVASDDIAIVVVRVPTSGPGSGWPGLGLAVG
jgi:serine phosphatase RsbU (regulator of sigma subunit)/PAS domain-containing protein